MSKKVLETLSSEDIDLIRITLIEQVDRFKSTSAPKIHTIVKDKLSAQIDESHFIPTLGLMLNNGMIKGYITKRGRFGGIYKEELKKITPSSIPTVAIPPPLNPIIPPAIVPTIEQPIQRKSYFSTREPLRNSLYDTNENFFLKIKDESYKIPCNKLYIKMLLEKVFDAQESLDGEIEFLGKKYSISNQKIFENTLLWFLNAVIVHTQE
jgi:hypothetical protein